MSCVTDSAAGAHTPKNAAGALGWALIRCSRLLARRLPGISSHLRRDVGHDAHLASLPPSLADRLVHRFIEAS